MNDKKRVVIIGGTSAIAEHCARLWLQKQPIDLTLVGRDARRIDRVATDLKVRSPQSEIRIVQADFMSPDAINTTVGMIVESGNVDVVLIAHGLLPQQGECQNDIQACRDALEINGVSPVLFAEAFAKHMMTANQGTIALISSVAGDRGRRSNYAYGSAKALVSTYAQGMQHRLVGTGVKVVLIKPGPTDTPMTAHLAASAARLAPVALVSRQIVNAIECGSEVVYTPRRWRLIMFLLRHLPSRIFNRLDI